MQLIRNKAISSVLSVIFAGCGLAACGNEALDESQKLTENTAGLAEACAPGEAPAPVAEAPAPTAPTTNASGVPVVAGCQMFPADNEWNRVISGDPVDPRSGTYIAAMNGGSAFIRADFGGNGEYGIPWVAVDGNQPRVPMTFDYDEDSDPGPYPIPENAPIEGGSEPWGDRHVLVLDQSSCTLYETFDSWKEGAGWRAGSGAIWNLGSNALRPKFLTSADAAGLPILPGLIRHDEIQAGKINHALRFTVRRTQRAFVHPATHFASVHTDASLPPLGLRVRLKKDFDISRFGRTAQIILTAMKEYGMLLADNGADWFVSGETNMAWNDDELRELSRVPASAFEAIAHGAVETR